MDAPGLSATSLCSRETQDWKPLKAGNGKLHAEVTSGRERAAQEQSEWGMEKGENRRVQRVRRQQKTALEVPVPRCLPCGTHHPLICCGLLEAPAWPKKQDSLALRGGGGEKLDQLKASSVSPHPLPPITL